MAFMMPVVKNDWDIYKSNRSSRRVSESSSVGGSGGPAGHSSGGRSRKVSEGAYSLSTSPASDVCGSDSPTHRSASSAYNGSAVGRPFGRSRMSEGCLMQTAASSPAKSASPSPRTSTSDSNIHAKFFHNNLLHKLKRTLKIKESKTSTSSSKGT